MLVFSGFHTCFALLRACLGRPKHDHLIKLLPTSPLAAESSKDVDEMRHTHAHTVAHKLRRLVLVTCCDKCSIELKGSELNCTTISVFEKKMEMIVMQWISEDVSHSQQTATVA